MTHELKHDVARYAWTAGITPSARRFERAALSIILLAMTVVTTTARLVAASSDATVTDPPTEVAVDFENPLDAQFVKLEVLDENGGEHAIGPPMVSADRRRLSVRVEGLKPGIFLVQWGVVDHHGNLSKGAFTFNVRRPDTLAGLTHLDSSRNSPHRTVENERSCKNTTTAPLAVNGRT